MSPTQTTLKNSHLWDGVTIKTDATVDESILCHGCGVKAGDVVPWGCIIGWYCVVGNNVKIPEFTRITLSLRRRETTMDSAVLKTTTTGSLQRRKTYTETDREDQRKTTVQTTP